MSDLYIHSMSEFSDLILAALERAGVAAIAEVGAEFGGMSQVLARHCAAHGGVLTSIDPAPRPEFLAWAQGEPALRHVAQTSLEALPALTGIEAFVLDGDHNYYTVLNELRIADELMRREGRPLLVFLHDVSWPCARRDAYYAPETVPAEHRHPYSYEAGVQLGNDGVVPNRGLRGMGQFAWALRAGGPRNGVLTAIEDFLDGARREADDPDGARIIAYAHVPAVLGLGVIFDCHAEWAPDLAAIFEPYHENALLGKLEANRLRNYLTVLEWQDRAV